MRVRQHVIERAGSTVRVRVFDVTVVVAQRGSFRSADPSRAVQDAPADGAVALQVGPAGSNQQPKHFAAGDIIDAELDGSARSPAGPGPRDLGAELALVLQRDSMVQQIGRAHV